MFQIEKITRSHLNKQHTFLYSCYDPQCPSIFLKIEFQLHYFTYCITTKVVIFTFWRYFYISQLITFTLVTIFYAIKIKGTFYWLYIHIKMCILVTWCFIWLSTITMLLFKDPHNTFFNHLLKAYSETKINILGGGDKKVILTKL